MNDSVKVLELSLYGRRVAWLAGFQGGRNVLIFADEFRRDPQRPTLSLITHPAFERSARLMAQPLVKHQRLYPTLSNLLPEGSLREFIALGLKVHVDNEFHLLAALGEDLPGALVARPLEPDAVPDNVLAVLCGKNDRSTGAIRFGSTDWINRFSLAGVQMKFSMKGKNGRYTLSSQAGVSGDWIIKTPSTRHKDVPGNEYTSMALAALVDVEIPEIALVHAHQLDNLPAINWPDESQALAIKRFDRDRDRRIHMEDFAQVLVKYPHEKYDCASYAQIARILYTFSGDPLADVQQFARRLLVNILLGNGDAHVKNWSLLYKDPVTPRLSPAYDIVATHVYVDGERHFALNLGKTKDWYQVCLSHFQVWSKKADLPWRAIKPHLDDVMDKARDQWPSALRKLPMNDSHKRRLVQHWSNLHPDFSV